MTPQKRPTFYDPNFLLDALLCRLRLTDDATLAKHVKLPRSMIRDLREGRIPIGATLSLLLEQTTGIALAEIRELMGDRRAKFRLALPIYNRTFLAETGHGT